MSPTPLETQKAHRAHEVLGNCSEQGLHDNQTIVKVHGDPTLMTQGVRNDKFY